jgi:hypothetical protein
VPEREQGGVPIVRHRFTATLRPMYSTIHPSQWKRHRTQQPAACRFCKIVTFYEDFSDAVRAVQKFDGIVQAFSGERPVHATSWSFDLLAKAHLNSIILDDVKYADVIVVATHGDRELPARIATWVEICIHAIPGTKPVLVALHDEGLEAEGVNAPLCASLHEIANRTDARFMCNRDLAQCVKRDVAEKPNGGGHGVPHSAHEPAQYATTESHRWWGLND